MEPAWHGGHPGIIPIRRNIGDCWQGQIAGAAYLLADSVRPANQGVPGMLTRCAALEYAPAYADAKNCSGSFDGRSNTGQLLVRAGTK
jgi:hypothetical protein